MPPDEIDFDALAAAARTSRAGVGGVRADDPDGSVPRPSGRVLGDTTPRRTINNTRSEGRGTGTETPSADEAFDALARVLRPRLVFALGRETRGRADAEDAAQAALLKLWENLERWDPQRPFMPWCFTVAFRCLRDQQRWAKRRLRSGVAATHDRADPSPGPAENAAAEEQTDRVWAVARDVLSPTAWTELWLHYGEGLTPAEIAEATGRRAVAVRVGLHRARKKLAPHLTEAGVVDAPDPPRPKESVTS